MCLKYKLMHLKYKMMHLEYKMTHLEYKMMSKLTVAKRDDVRRFHFRKRPEKRTVLSNIFFVYSGIIFGHFFTISQELPCLLFGKATNTWDDLRKNDKGTIMMTLT